MSTSLPPPPESPGNEVIPSRLRSVDIRTLLLIFVAFSLFCDINQLLVSVSYSGFSSIRTFVLLVPTAFDLILLDAALTNGIISLHINRAISLVLWAISTTCFFMSLVGLYVIVFRFGEYRTHLFNMPDEKPTYPVQVFETLLLSSIMGAYCFFLFVRFVLVNSTLKAVQMERNLELLPIRTV